MKFSSDVNVIFGFKNCNNPFHNKIIIYLLKNQRREYFLLHKVRSVFIYTYKDYLNTSCNIIDKAIRNEKFKRNKSPSKTYKPSPFAITENVQKLIYENIKEQQNKYQNFNTKAVKKFIDLMLSEFSIPELYENDESLANFREKYIIESEKKALQTLNEFLNSFKKFQVMNIEHYKKHESWIKKIKSSKNTEVFENKRDEEDINLASEYFAFNEEIGKLNFCSCDRNLCKSLPLIAKEYKQKIGHIHLFKK